MFYIYKITNKINGKLYIGKTNNPYQRMHVHLTVAKLGAENDFYLINGQYSLLQRAITKHGADNFDFNIVEENEYEEVIFEREKYWIAFYKTNVCRYGPDYGYNLTDGGEGSSGRKHSENAKQKMREKATGRLHSPETKELLSQQRAGKNSIKNKLTWDDVYQIRLLRSTENTSYAKLARKFLVSEPMIRDICLNKKWKV
jgi:group I intron endonuclease